MPLRPACVMLCRVVGDCRGQQEEEQPLQQTGETTGRLLSRPVPGGPRLPTQRTVVDPGGCLVLQVSVIGRARAATSGCGGQLRGSSRLVLGAPVPSSGGLPRSLLFGLRRSGVREPFLQACFPVRSCRILLRAQIRAASGALGPSWLLLLEHPGSLWCLGVVGTLSCGAAVETMGRVV